MAIKEKKSLSDSGKRGQVGLSEGSVSELLILWTYTAAMTREAATLTTRGNHFPENVRKVTVLLNLSDNIK